MERQPRVSESEVRVSEETLVSMVFMVSTSPQRSQRRTQCFPDGTEKYDLGTYVHVQFIPKRTFTSPNSTVGNGVVMKMTIAAIAITVKDIESPLLEVTLFLEK